MNEYDCRDARGYNNSLVSIEDQIFEQCRLRATFYPDRKCSTCSRFEPATLRFGKISPK